MDLGAQYTIAGHYAPNYIISYDRVIMQMKNMDVAAVQHQQHQKYDLEDCVFLLWFSIWEPWGKQNISTFVQKSF